MTKQSLRKSYIVLSLALFTSGSTVAFAQRAVPMPNTATLAMGDPGGGLPDPTGGNGGSGNLALRTNTDDPGGGLPDPTGGNGGGPSGNLLALHLR